MGRRRWRKDREKQAGACGPVQLFAGLNNPASCTFKQVSLKVGSAWPSKLPHPPRFLPETPQETVAPISQTGKLGEGWA